jgi:hypothetical protein
LGRDSRWVARLGRAHGVPSRRTATCGVGPALRILRALGRSGDLSLRRAREISAEGRLRRARDSCRRKWLRRSFATWTMCRRGAQECPRGAQECPSCARSAGVAELHARRRSARVARGAVGAPPVRPADRWADYGGFELRGRGESVRVRGGSVQERAGERGGSVQERAGERGEGCGGRRRWVRVFDDFG